jgi:multiple sugar transport system substrate-binding protein
MRSLGYALTVLGIGAALIAGCGGDDGDDGAAAGDGKQSATAPISPDAADSATGKVTVCLPKDVSGAFHKTIDAFNKDSEVQAELLELPESADQQRNQLITRAQSKSAECDVIGIDVIWTAEFANEGWVKDLSQVVEQRKAEFIASTLETGKYEGKHWALPHNSNAALLYYRTDAVKDAPATWEDTYKLAAQHDGLVYQGAAYEGLTCDYLEIAFAAGGKVLSEDGQTAEFDSPENVKALQFMVDGIKNGAAPKAVTTYMEEEARLAFEGGRATFMRNWPYAFATAKKNKKAPEFEVAAFPTFQGGGKAGILGGHNDVISVNGKNPGGAIKVLEFLADEAQHKILASEFSLPPTIASVYDDPEVKKALPFAAELKQAIAQAKSRPVSPVYPQISAAIYKNVNEALSGSVTPEEALKNGQAQMEQALKTF